MSTKNRSPLVLPLKSIAPGAQNPEYLHQTGPSPSRIGTTMLAIAEGSPLEVDATVIPIGDGILIQAHIHATTTGQCVRCLADLEQDFDADISGVFSADAELINSDDDDELDAEDKADAAVYPLSGDTIDLEQLLIDEACLALPFNPACENGCANDATGVPEPDGVSGEEDAGVDPRWAGLEKFL
ncbi:MAG: YceD family protein [Corynebacterium sp.]|nr:YceD family protein [Corynebacterium sp.]